MPIEYLYVTGAAFLFLLGYLVGTSNVQSVVKEKPEQAWLVGLLRPEGTVIKVTECASVVPDTISPGYAILCVLAPDTCEAISIARNRLSKVESVTTTNVTKDPV